MKRSQLDELRNLLKDAHENLVHVGPNSWLLMTNNGKTIARVSLVDEIPRLDSQERDRELLKI